MWIAYKNNSPHMISIAFWTQFRSRLFSLVSALQLKCEIGKDQLEADLKIDVIE